MPQTVYLCEVCKAVYKKHEDAVKCEAKKPKYTVGEKVCFESAAGDRLATIKEWYAEDLSYLMIDCTHVIMYVVEWGSGRIGRVAENFLSRATR